MTEQKKLSEKDYKNIESAVMETEQGRWFLSEFRKRNRTADTSLLLDAINKLEAMVATKQPESILIELKNEFDEAYQKLKATRKKIHKITGVNDSLNIDEITDVNDDNENDSIDLAPKVDDLAPKVDDLATDTDDLESEDLVAARADDEIISENETAELSNDNTKEDDLDISDEKSISNENEDEILNALSSEEEVPSKITSNELDVNEAEMSSHSEILDSHESLNNAKSDIFIDTDDKLNKDDNKVEMLNLIDDEPFPNQFGSEELQSLNEMPISQPGDYNSSNEVNLNDSKSIPPINGTNNDVSHCQEFATTISQQNASSYLQSSIDKSLAETQNNSHISEFNDENLVNNNSIEGNTALKTEKSVKETDENNNKTLPNIEIVNENISSSSKPKLTIADIWNTQKQLEYLGINVEELADVNKAAIKEYEDINQIIDTENNVDDSTSTPTDEIAKAENHSADEQLSIEELHKKNEKILEEIKKVKELNRDSGIEELTQDQLHSIFC